MYYRLAVVSWRFISLDVVIHESINHNYNSICPIRSMTMHSITSINISYFTLSMTISSLVQQLLFNNSVKDYSSPYFEKGIKKLKKVNELVTFCR